MVVEGEHPGEHVVGRLGRRGAGGRVAYEPDELDGAAEEEAVARAAHAVAREVALQPPRPPPQRLHEPRHRHVQAQPRRRGERGPLPRPRPWPRPPHDGPGFFVRALRRWQHGGGGDDDVVEEKAPAPAPAAFSWWQEAAMAYVAAVPRLIYIAACLATEEEFLAGCELFVFEYRVRTILPSRLVPFVWPFILFFKFRRTFMGW